MKINSFIHIIEEVDDIDNGLYLHIDNENSIVDLSFEENNKYKNYHLHDFNEDFRIAIDTDDNDKIDYFNNLIKQANDFVNLNFLKYADILIEYYKQLINKTKDEEVQEHLFNTITILEDIKVDINNKDSDEV